VTVELNLTLLTVTKIKETDKRPPQNGEIALWPNTRVVKRKYYASQKQNGFNNKIHSYSILLTFIFKFTARLSWTKIFVPSNLSKDGKTTIDPWAEQTYIDILTDCFK